MRIKILFLITFSFLILCTQAQDKATAQSLIAEGIKFHDAGLFDSALAKYRGALSADSNNLNTLYEMSYTFYIAKRYDSSIYLSENLIDAKPPDAILKNVYVNLGSAFDDMNETAKSLSIYDEGIKKFPDFYLLYFNKGITLLFNNQTENAKEAFEKTITLNPLHTGSHYWLSMILTTENKIPAIMAASMVCITENNSGRAAKSAALIDSLLMRNSSPQDSSSKNITLYLPASKLNIKNKENDFAFAEIGLSIMQQASFNNDSLKLNTHEKQFAYTYQVFCDLLQNKKKQKGFYWRFYAPFFYAAKQNGYTDIITRLILQHIDSGESAAWLAAHQPDVDKFNGWLNNFLWAKN